MRRSFRSQFCRWTVALALMATLVVLPRSEAGAQTVIPTRAETVFATVTGEAVLDLPFTAQHVALHWTGHPDAEVSVAFSTGDGGFGPLVSAGRDETAVDHPSGNTYGAVIGAGGATRLRVVTDRPIGRLNALIMADGEPQSTTTERVAADEAGATEYDGVITRAGWGANESLRFRRNKEIWPQAFARVQKLVVHHTADPTIHTTPAQAQAELRAVYYYHTVTLGWGDIGYNFLVDRLGNVYKGRFSGKIGPTQADSLTGEDDQGRVVTAGHTFEHNVSTIGIAIMGDYSGALPSELAQNRLRNLLIWEANRHHLDPARQAPYRNLINDRYRTDTLNLDGHREYVATECPGDSFHDWLNGTFEQPGLRDQVRRALSSPDGDLAAPDPPTMLTGVGGRRKATLTWTPSPETWGEGPDGQTGVAFYEIQRRTGTNGPFVAVEHVADNVVTFTEAPARGSYEYRLVAVDGAGNTGPFSDVVPVTVT